MVKRVTPSTKTSSKRQTMTIAQCLYHIRDPRVRAELEAFRVAYETTHGPTDLTLRYTSLWPKAQQVWLFNNHPELYYKGLPAFAQAWLAQQMRDLAANGELDDAKKPLLKLFIDGKMRGR